MIEVAAYLGIVLAIAGIGVWVGMIVAGRIDRRLVSPDTEPPSASQEEQP